MLWLLTKCRNTHPWLLTNVETPTRKKEEITKIDKLDVIDLLEEQNQLKFCGLGGFGAKDDKNNVNRESKMDTNKELQTSISEVGRNQNGGIYQSGFLRRNIQEQVANNSRRYEVELNSNEPIQHGFNEHSYYQNFGKSDKKTQIQNVPQNYTPPTNPNKNDDEGVTYRIKGRNLIKTE